MWRSEDKLQEPILSFYHMDPGERTQVIQPWWQACFLAERSLWPLAYGSLFIHYTLSVQKDGSFWATCQDSMYLKCELWGHV